MGYINIFIGSEETVRVKEGKLVVREGREGFPLEDINCVMADNRASTFPCMPSTS